MTVTVLLFAAARDGAGRSSLSIDVAEGTTARQLVEACVAAAPALGPLAPYLRVAMNHALVSSDTTIVAGELALLPPVSGG